MHLARNEQTLTPMISQASMTARSASVMGVMSPKPARHKAEWDRVHRNVWVLGLHLRCLQALPDWLHSSACSGVPPARPHLW